MSAPEIQDMNGNPDRWQLLKDHFHELLELAAPDQERVLNDVSFDEAMRQSLGELLRAHESAGSFLQLQTALDGLETPGGVRGRLDAGFVLADRFRVVRFIAAGGMGEVYEALDLELNHPVAIKIVRPEIAAIPGMCERFRREVQLARQVTHPNVCRIYDIFRHREAVREPILFLSMELLHGRTLAAELEEKPCLPAGQAIAILRQVAAGLDAAHAEGILHRDLKPGNILLEPDRNGALRAVITDFGMAKGDHELTAQTTTGASQMLLGTVAYMSPEQIEEQSLTPASDLYSMGLIAYQMVTGHNPFTARSPLHAAARRMTEVPQPPSHLRPDLDPAWDRALVRCLERDPKKRFHTALEFVAALAAPVLPPAGVSTGEGDSTPGVKPRRIAGTWLAGASLACLSLVAGGLWLYATHDRARPAPVQMVSVVLADFVNTTGESVFDNTLNISLAAKLQQSPFLSLMSAQKIRQGLRYMGRSPQERLTEEVAREVCQRENGQVVLQGFIANIPSGYGVGIRAIECATGRTLAERQFPVEYRDSVLDALDRAADAIRPVLGESAASIRRYDVPLTEATTPSFEALTAFTQGTQVWNEHGEAAALPYFQKATAIDPNFAMAYARLGTIYGNLGETKRANRVLLQAYDRRDRVTEWERFYIVSHYYGFVTGEVDREMQTYEEWSRVYPHDTAWIMNLSVDYALTGQYDKAIDLQRRSIREIPGNAPAYGNLAQLFLAVDRPDEAQTVLDQASEMNLQDVNIQLDKYLLAFYRDDAAGMAQAVAGAAQIPGAEDTLLSTQAETDGLEGKLSSAQQMARKSAQVSLRAGTPETSANWLASEAVRQAELGDAAAARSLLQDALANPKVADGSDVQTLSALAYAYLGEAQRARTLVAELSSANPRNTLIQSYWAPVLRARLALAGGHAIQAIAALAGTEPYDLGIFTPGQCMDAALARGQALLALRRYDEAALQFRLMLAHRGLILNSPNLAMAQWGLARALAGQGDGAASRHAYQDLFALWRNADPDFAPLGRARQEYRSLR